MTNLSVVVAGLPVLAAALQSSGGFANVLSASSTQELRQVITGPTLKGVGKGEVVFVFADNLPSDERLPFPSLVQKLSTSGWRVLLIGMTPAASELARTNPAAGLLLLPITTNMVLGAISGFGFSVVPDENGYDQLDLSGRAAPVAAPAAQAPAARVTEPAAAPRLGGWSTPPSDPAPAPKVVKPAAAPVAAPAAFSNPFPEQKKSSSTPAASPFPDAAPAASPGGWSTPPAEVEVPSAWNSAPVAAAPAARTFEEAPSSTGGWGMPTGEPVVSMPTSRGFEEAPSAGGWGATTVDAPPARRALSNLPDPDAVSFEKSYSEPVNSWQPGPAGGPAARAGGYNAEHAIKERRGMVITIAVSKGGTGKSSLTLNLAAFLALRLRGEGKTVCVIDTNFQQADAGKYLNIYSPNIMSIANDPTLLARERIGQALANKPELNLSALLGPATPDDGNPQWITARLYNEILDLLKEKFDYIFIDTPVAEKFHSIFSQFALPRADFIIVPVTPNQATLHNADNWLRSAVTAPKHANGVGVAAEKIGIVLNQAKDNIGCSEDDVRANLAHWTFLGAIPETDEWKKCNNKFELVAIHNYAELDEAFAQVLYHVTQEETLLASFRGAAPAKSGWGAKLKSMFAGKS